LQSAYGCSFALQYVGVSATALENLHNLE
jgi:hypothetical protein